MFVFVLLLIAVAVIVVQVLGSQSRSVQTSLSPREAMDLYRGSFLRHLNKISESGTRVDVTPRRRYPPTLSMEAVPLPGGGTEVRLWVSDWWWWAPIGFNIVRGHALYAWRKNLLIAKKFERAGSVPVPGASTDVAVEPPAASA